MRQRCDLWNANGLQRLPLLLLPVLPGLLVALLAVLPGCLRLDREPEMESAAPPASPDSSFDVVRVFYGTDRNRTGETHWNRFYGNRPASLEYGICEVSIPATHRYGQIERPSIWRLELQETPDRHIMLQSIEPQSAEEFLSRLRSDVAQSEQQEAFVFVHGYNVTFAQASYRTAQMAHDLRFSGPPILFSWPSQGELSGYVADLTAADQARAHLRMFLETVARDSGASRIHLIAHSMGNRIVTEVLGNLAEEATGRDIPAFEQIILAAPDVDAATFKREIAPRMVRAGQRVTIYASARDRALQASQLLHRSSRLGQGGPYLTTFPDFPTIEAIDATDVDFSFFDLGHAEYGDSLLADVRLTLNGLPARERGLLPHEHPAAWVVPAMGAEQRTDPVILASHELEPADETVQADLPADVPDASSQRRIFWGAWKKFWPFR